MGKGAAAVSQPVHFEAGDESTDVFFEFDDVRNTVGVAAWQVFLENFEDGGFAGEKGGEDALGEFAGAFFDGFDGGVGEFSAQAGDDGFEGGNAFVDDILARIARVGDEFDVIGETVGEFAGAEKLDFAGSEVVNFAGKKREKGPRAAERLEGPLDAETIDIECLGEGGGAAGAFGGEGELPAPAKPVKNVGGIDLRMVSREDEILKRCRIGGGGGMGVMLVFAIVGESAGDDGGEEGVMARSTRPRADGVVVEWSGGRGVGRHG